MKTFVPQVAADRAPDRRRGHGWASTGAAFLLAIGPGVAGAGESILAVDWSNTDSRMVRLDSELGAPEHVASTGFGGLNALARHPSGVFYSVDGDGVLLTIDPDTGAGAAAATIDLGGTTVNMPGLACSPGGVLYAVNNGVPDELYIIDVSTGAGVLVGPTGQNTLQALAFAPDGTLYGWDVVAGLFTLDTATGAATDVNPTVGADPEIQCLAFAPDGTLYGAHRDLLTVDPATGIPEVVVAMAGVGIRGMEFTPAPELRLRLSRNGTDAEFCWISETNQVYQLQQRQALGPTNGWSGVGPVLVGTGGELCLTNSFPDPYRFFRVRSAPVPGS